MNSGFGTEGSKYLRFCAVDERTAVKEEIFFGVKKAVACGMGILEL
jgi:hypothetical protein